MLHNQPRDCLVLVENLRVFTLIKRIKEHFSSYGVKQIWLHAEMCYKDSTRDAHILFETPAAAKEAVEEQNGVMFNERPMKLKVMTDEDEIQSKILNRRRAVSIGNVISDTTDEDLMKYFTVKVGEIKHMYRILKQDVVVIQFKKSVRLGKCFALDGKDYKGRILRMKHWTSPIILREKQKKAPKIPTVITERKERHKVPQKEIERRLKEMLAKNNMSREQFANKFKSKDNGIKQFLQKQRQHQKRNKNRVERRIIRRKADKIEAILDRII